MRFVLALIVLLSNQPAQADLVSKARAQGAGRPVRLIGLSHSNVTATALPDARTPTVNLPARDIFETPTVLTESLPQRQQTVSPAAQPRSGREQLGHLAQEARRPTRASAAGNSGFDSGEQPTTSWERDVSVPDAPGGNPPNSGRPVRNRGGSGLPHKLPMLLTNWAVMPDNDIPIGGDIPDEVIKIARDNGGFIVLGSRVHDDSGKVDVPFRFATVARIAWGPDGRPMHLEALREARLKSSRQAPSQEYFSVEVEYPEPIEGNLERRAALVGLVERAAPLASNPEEALSYITAGSSVKAFINRAIQRLPLKSVVKQHLLATHSLEERIARLIREIHALLEPRQPARVAGLQNVPRELTVITTNTQIFFPGAHVTWKIHPRNRNDNKDEVLKALREAAADGGYLIMASPMPHGHGEELFPVSTLVRCVDTYVRPDGMLEVIIEAIDTVTITDYTTNGDGHEKVRYHFTHHKDGDAATEESLSQLLKSIVSSRLRGSHHQPGLGPIINKLNPASLAAFIAYYSGLVNASLQHILEATSIQQRLERLIEGHWLQSSRGRYDDVTVPAAIPIVELNDIPFPEPEHAISDFSVNTQPGDKLFSLLYDALQSETFVFAVTDRPQGTSLHHNPTGIICRVISRFDHSYRRSSFVLQGIKVARISSYVEDDNDGPQYVRIDYPATITGNVLKVQSLMEEAKGLILRVGPDWLPENESKNYADEGNPILFVNRVAQGLRLPLEAKQRLLRAFEAQESATSVQRRLELLILELKAILGESVPALDAEGVPLPLTAPVIAVPMPPLPHYGRKQVVVRARDVAPGVANGELNGSPVLLALSAPTDGMAPTQAATLARIIRVAQQGAGPDANLKITVDTLRQVRFTKPAAADAQSQATIEYPIEHPNKQMEDGLLEALQERLVELRNPDGLVSEQLMTIVERLSIPSVVASHLSQDMHISKPEDRAKLFEAPSVEKRLEELLRIVIEYKNETEPWGAEDPARAIAEIRRKIEPPEEENPPDRLDEPEPPPQL